MEKKSLLLELQMRQASGHNLAANEAGKRAQPDAKGNLSISTVKAALSFYYLFVICPIKSKSDGWVDHKRSQITVTRSGNKRGPFRGFAMGSFEK
jgi:hypothetical protein